MSSSDKLSAKRAANIMKIYDCSLYAQKNDAPSMKAARNVDGKRENDDIAVPVGCLTDYTAHKTDNYFRIACYTAPLAENLSKGTWSGECDCCAGQRVPEGDAEGVEVEAVGFAAVVRRFRFDGVPSIQPVADDGA